MTVETFLLTAVLALLGGFVGNWVLWQSDRGRRESESHAELVAATRLVIVELDVVARFAENAMDRELDARGELPMTVDRLNAARVLLVSTKLSPELRERLADAYTVGLPTIVGQWKDLTAQSMADAARVNRSLHADLTVFLTETLHATA